MSSPYEVIETMAFSPPQLNLTEKQKKYNQAIILRNLPRVLAKQKNKIPPRVFEQYTRPCVKKDLIVLGFDLTFFAMVGYFLMSKNKLWYNLTTNIRSSYLRLSILVLIPFLMNIQFRGFQVRYVTENKDILEPVFQDYIRENIDFDKIEQLQQQSQLFKAQAPPPDQSKPYQFKSNFSQSSADRNNAPNSRSSYIS